MSHFVAIKTEFRHKESLLKALTELNLTARVYETAESLVGYYGSSQGKSAEIVISRSSLPESSKADVGFKWNSDCYEAIYDPYETDRSLGKQFFSHTLPRTYAKHVTIAQAEKQFGRGNYTIHENISDGFYKLRITTAPQAQVRTRR